MNVDLRYDDEVYSFLCVELLYSQWLKYWIVEEKQIVKISFVILEHIYSENQTSHRSRMQGTIEELYRLIVTLLIAVSLLERLFTYSQFHTHRYLVKNRCGGCT